MEYDFSKQIKELNKDYKVNYLSSFDVSEIISSVISEKTQKHNDRYENKVSEDQLKRVYLRGSHSYNSTHRVGKTKSQWAMARVNMFLKCNRGENVDEQYIESEKDIISNRYREEGENICSFFSFSDLDLNLANLDLVKAGLEKWDQDAECEELFYSEAEKKTLNKPFRLKGESKKFGVYVKSPKTGNVIVVKFGDPNMEIKRDDPDRRRSFRARHKCDTAKDKTTPRYWSCKMWSKKPVNKSVSSEAVEWDDEEILSQWCWDESCVVNKDEILEINPDLKYIDYIVEDESI